MSTDSALSIIGDPGFEQVAVGDGHFNPSPIGSAWTFSGSGISGNGSGYTNGNPVAPDGVQVAYIQGDGSFVQSVAGWSSGSYVLNFKAAQRANYGGVQDFNVLIDGTVVGCFTPSGTSYQQCTTSSFVVVAGTHEIKFQGLSSAGGDNTAFIDDLSLSAGVDPVAMTQSQVFQYYQKTSWSWVDRLGIKTPDITGLMEIPAASNTYASTAGTLVVYADSAKPNVSVGIVIVLWDNRHNPMSVVPRAIYTSGWAKNHAGNFIGQSGSNDPGFVAVDVSLASGYSVLVQSILPDATVNLHWKLF